MTWEIIIGWPDGHRQRIEACGPETMAEMLAVLSDEDGALFELEQPWSKAIRISLFSQEHAVDWSSEPNRSKRIIRPR